MVKVLAQIYYLEGGFEKVKDLIAEQVELTRKEKGCIEYDYFQDDKDPCKFVFVETWETMEDLQNHLKSEHLTRIPPLTAPYTDPSKKDVSTFTKIF